MRKSIYQVYYSVFINGTEYPDKVLSYEAQTDDEASRKFKKEMSAFPETDYRVLKIVKFK